MKINKFWIIIGALIAIFLAVLLWPKTKEETNTKTFNKNITEPISEYSMDTPKLIEWGEIADKNYPITKALLTEKRVYDVNQKIQIRNLVFTTNNSKAIYDFDDNRNIVEFSENIENSKQIEKGSELENDIKTSFFELTQKTGESTNLEIKTEKTNYKKFLYPWWISGNDKDFDAIEILGNYYYQNIPIKTFGGYMIKASYFTNGKLVKLEQQLPFEKISKTTDKNLWTLAELKKIDRENFKIWNIDGGAEFELSGETPVIDKIKITDYQLEYIYDIKSGVVWPYYFLTGESGLDTGKVQVILIVSAVKE